MAVADGFPGNAAGADWLARIEEAAAFLRGLGEAPQAAVILGSGLAAFAERLVGPVTVTFEQIPHFRPVSVAGHPGCLVSGRLGEGGPRIVALQGRLHRYEGYSPAEVAFPARVLCRLGIRALVVTNAAGCIHPDWEPGDLMRIADHVNLSGDNPLVGPNDPQLGPRFPDLTRAYDPELASLLEASARSARLRLRAGIYACVLGPSYETPAEIRMLRALGADAVGMSTVPEVIAAAHMGVPVAGISCLTNMAAGILDQPLSHAEVTAAAAAASARFIALLEAFLPRAVEALEARASAGR